MAYKTLLFGTDDMFNQLKPFYDEQVKRGILNVVARVDNVSDPTADYKPSDFDITIISSHEHFFERMKSLEAQGFPRNKIIDGRVFKVPQLNLPRLLAEGVAYGVFDDQNSFKVRATVYPQSYSFKNSDSVIFVDKKSYIYDNVSIERNGDISVGKFSSLSWNILFEFELNIGHNKANVMQYSRFFFDWQFPEEFMSPQGKCQISIGSDVWCGRGVIFKSNPEPAACYRRRGSYRGGQRRRQKCSALCDCRWKSSADYQVPFHARSHRSTFANQMVGLEPRQNSRQL